MAVFTSTLSLSTRGNTEIMDITDRVAQAVTQSGLKNGIVTIFCPSSTGAVTTIEHEAGLLRDFRRFLDEWVDAKRAYDHNATWGENNGHSHLRATLLKASLTVPFVNARLTLGTWQQIIYIDLDIKPRHRELVLQLMGE